MLFILWFSSYFIVYYGILMNITCPRCKQEINEAYYSEYLPNRIKVGKKIIPSKTCQKCGYDLTRRVIR